MSRALYSSRSSVAAMKGIALDREHVFGQRRLNVRRGECQRTTLCEPLAFARVVLRELF